MSYEDPEDIPMALAGIAYQIRNLGNAGASTPMGAIEAFGLVMKDGMSEIAGALGEIAEAQREQAAAIGEYLEWRRKAGI
ncbi:MAG: hypothetical protein NUW01_00025 [Gemmatimonadaceae bacterium]|nr:hypothetical protein [Gemmatimonadaceae bacterium]